MTALHVLLALTSLSFASHNLIRPAANRLKISYGLAAGTLTSGVALIFVNHASVLRTCLTGIIFFSIVTVLNELARHKLAPQKQL